MKRWFLLAGIVALGLSALTLGQLHKNDVVVGPRALLNFVADSGRELARVPVTLMPLSDADEIRIGNEMAQAYEYQVSRENDVRSKEIQPYIEKVGRWVAGHAHRKLPYRFHFISDRSFLNAFALPGGHVYVGAGLIDLMDSEDELANILGHEVEHIDRRHCAERIQLEGRARHLPLGELVRLPIELFEAGYSKNEELEADREGIALAVKADYSPVGAIRMFQAIGKLYQEQQSPARSPQQELSRVARETLEGYFRSHPPTAERIEQIREMIAENHWESLGRERRLEIR